MSTYGGFFALSWELGMSWKLGVGNGLEVGSWEGVECWVLGVGNELNVGCWGLTAERFFAFYYCLFA